MVGVPIVVGWMVRVASLVMGIAWIIMALVLVIAGVEITGVRLGAS